MADDQQQRRLTAKRRHARRCALQALYTWGMTGNDIRDVEQHFHEEHDMTRADTEYFGRLLRGVATSVTDIDGRLSEFVSRPVEQIDPVEKAALRLACYELEHCLEVPARVIVAEAVQLAKTFGSDQSHKFINGVIDRVARSMPMRESEFARRD